MKMKQLRVKATQDLILTVKDLLKTLEEGYIGVLNNQKLRKEYIKTIGGTEELLKQETKELREQNQELTILKKEPDRYEVDDDRPDNSPVLG